MKDYLFNCSEKIREIDDEVKAKVLGKKAKITSLYYNGQPYGKSKPVMTGKIFEVVSVIVNRCSCWLWDGNVDHTYININEIEFVE